MLSRLLLIVIQLAVGWYAGLALLQVLPDLHQEELFLSVLVFALIVWVLGALAAAVLKDVAQPSIQTLVFSLACGVIFALITLLPDAERAITHLVGDVPRFIYPLVGSVVGYAIQR